jgi:hypothetical protein
MRGDGLVNPYRGEPTLPAVVHAMADARTGRDAPLVLTLDQPADYEPMWPDALGVIVEAQRKGIRACMADRSFEFLVTEEFVCSADEVAAAPSSPSLRSVPMRAASLPEVRAPRSRWLREALEDVGTDGDRTERVNRLVPTTPAFPVRRTVDRASAARGPDVPAE